MAYTGPSIVDYLNSTGQASDFKSRSVLAQQKGIQNYSGTAEQNTQLLGILRTPTPAPTTNAPISANTLNQTNTQPIAAAPYNPAPAPAPVQSIEDIMKQYAAPTAQETQYNQNQNNIYGQIESIINKSGQQSARQAELEGQTVAPLQKQLNEINSQIGAINASAFKETERAENRLAPTFAISGEQAQIERQKSVQTYGLAAAASALTGQVALAQQNVQRALQAEFGGLESQLQYQQLLLERNKDQLSAIDKKKTEALQIALQQRTEALAEQKASKKLVYDVFVEAASAGADNRTLTAIQNASSEYEALKLAAGAGLFTSGQPINSQVVKLDNGNTVLLNTDTGEIIRNIGGAKPATGSNVQPGAIVDANGKPLKLTATQVDTISGFDNTKISSQEALALLAKGVETGPVAGRTLQAKKLAGTQDPDQLKLEQNLQKIKSDFMKAISGAAVSESEVKRLSKFLPDITDQESVLKSKLDSLVYESQKFKDTYMRNLGAVQTQQVIVAPDGTEIIITD